MSEHPVDLARRLAEGSIPISMRPAGWGAWWDEQKLIADEEITAEQAEEEYAKFRARFG